MGKIIKLTESQLKEVIKTVISEEKIINEQQSSPYKIISGPYKPINEVGFDLYIVRLEQSMCRDDRREGTRFNMVYMTGTTCPQDFTPFPANRMYLFWPSSSGLRMFTPDHQTYVLATNNGQGYGTEEEAKKAVAKIINPQGRTGRQVRNFSQDGVNYKSVSKYDRQGNLIKVKTTSKDTDLKTPGNQRYKETQRTGL
jgi:hypothetical protein